MLATSALVVGIVLAFGGVAFVLVRDESARGLERAAHGVAAGAIVLGIMRADAPGQARFTPRERRLLGVLGSIARLALDRVDLEERLAEAERFSAIGELAASVAHEINNPLTGDLGIAEIVQASVAGGALFQIDLLGTEIAATTERM